MSDVQSTENRSDVINDAYLLLILQLGKYAFTDIASFTMIIPLARVAVAAIAASVAINSGLNVYETAQISRQSTAKRNFAVTNGNRTVRSSNAALAAESCIPTSIAEIESLSRKQILQLYIDHCVAPSDLSVLDGEWSGKLLNNNGLVRTALFLLF
jgi:hypothetical protein